MTAAEDRIQALYRVFNNRDFDGFFHMLAPDVDWTNDLEDTRLIGKDALRAYILDETGALRAEYTPIHLQTLSDGRVSVLVRQVIRSAADGSVWSSTRVRHIFRLDNDLVTRMDADRDGGPGADEDRDPLMVAFYEAVDRQDIEGVMAAFHPQARIPDGLEDGLVSGLAEIRAYYIRQFATVRLGFSLLSTQRLTDDRLEALLHVVVRGAGGGFWWEGPMTVSARLCDGLIIEMGAANVAMDGA